MNVSEVMRGRGGRWLLAACLLLTLLPLLPGCANKDRDLMTDSDEPAVRKRASLRLQLAGGYFTQGKTTVALDEVKQAINTDPSFADAYNLRGLIYMRLAEDSLQQRAAFLNPEDPNVRLSEESFQRALSLSSDDPNMLHNYGWLQCQEGRIPEAVQTFKRVLDTPTYANRSLTWRSMGVCQIKAKQYDAAEQSLHRSYELDAGNVATGYNLAQLLYDRGNAAKALFYIRRINNSEGANAATLWLGIKIENSLGNRVERDQLGDQLRARYPKSRELNSYERGAFHE